MVHANYATALYESRLRIERANRRATLLGSLGAIPAVAAPEPLKRTADRPLLATVEIRRLAEAEAFTPPRAA